MKIKAYHFRYPGLWMGGKIVVVAKTERTARKIALAEADPCSAEELTLLGVFHLDEPRVLYNDNGDY